MDTELLGELSQRKPLCSTCDHPMKTHYEGGCIQCDECSLDFPDVLDAHLAARVASAVADREVESQRLRRYHDVVEAWLWRWQTPPDALADLRAALSAPTEADGAGRGCEHWSREAELARLDKHGSSLDRFNVNLVCERMADYPELIAAVAALPDRLVVGRAGARERIAEALMDALCDSPVWAERHIGELEWHLCGGFADAVLAGWDGLG